MIEANELRIGNLLMGTLTQREVVVDWLVIKHVQDNGNVQAPPYDMRSVYEPIVLTEEWLKRLGFVHDVIGIYRYEIGRQCFYISSSEDNHTVYRSDIGLSAYPVGYCESIHHLQNLYYILTGQELTIKW